ncbi:MAG: endonuclease/exonuclease/phosphatase family protein [Ilumatobacter sp.]|uniref:endonuclease/exonuclease/phosphatase family protein n=1 Tax=Ilumatobacter sp. TaxID=1967498 RepID=UPI0032967D99
MQRRPLTTALLLTLAGAAVACSSSGSDSDTTASTGIARGTTAAIEVTTPTETVPDSVSGPAPTEPVSTDPVVSEPTNTEPVATEPTGTEPTGTEPGVEFELLTYNVAGLPAALSGSEPDVNTALIGERINDYDVVLVQESWLTFDEPDAPASTYHQILLDASEHLFTSESLAQPRGTDPDRPTAQLSDGLNRFSNFEIGDVERIRWNQCGDASADCLSLKGFSVSTVDIGGAEVDLYNLHLDAGREDFAVRADNVAQLIAHIEAEASGRAVIVGGDFNLRLERDPDGDQFADLLASAGLTDVCSELDCPEPGRIDKVLYRSSEDIEITALEWRNDSEIFTRDDGAPLSDHDPVVVTFEVATTD